MPRRRRTRALLRGESLCPVCRSRLTIVLRSHARSRNKSVPFARRIQFFYAEEQTRERASHSYSTYSPDPDCSDRCCCIFHLSIQRRGASLAGVPVRFQDRI